MKSELLKSVQAMLSSNIIQEIVEYVPDEKTIQNYVPFVAQYKKKIAKLSSKA